MKKQAGRPEIEPELYTDITLSWILKCYDRQVLSYSNYELLMYIHTCSGRTGVVKVHSLMIGLVALCHATIQEKYACEFLPTLQTF